MNKEHFYRIEIIANQAVREDILKEFETIKCTYFTELPLAYGQGRQEPKQGDSIWPETNLIFIVYASQAMLDQITISLGIIKQQFPHEGIKLFAVPAIKL